MNPNKKTILLVDDDPILGNIMQKRVEEEGYVCLWERDGKEGLARLASAHPDLLLLDIVMPNMNGYEVLDHIHNDPAIASVPVIVISNSGQPVEIQRILELGVKDYIVKAHFSPEEVITKIKGVIGEGAKSSQDNGGTHAKKLPESTKILIIEDDPMLSDIASDRFRRDGYKVFTAPDGRDGIAIALAEHPDIILLDIIMPGMSGFEVLAELKKSEETKPIPVIIFSNLAQDRDIAEGRRLGAIDFFVKANFTPAQVVERVKGILAAL